MPGRIEIDGVAPVVSCGTHPAKAVTGEIVPVCATVWREGHEAVAATLVVRYLGPHYPQPGKHPSAAVRVTPQLSPMTPGRTPDVFHGQFTPDQVGLWTFRVDGWGDPITTWRHAVTAKLDAGQGAEDLRNDLLVGADLLMRAATGVPRAERAPLLEAAAELRRPGDPLEQAALALSHHVTDILAHYPLRDLVTRGQAYGVWVDRHQARCGSWYEMFPRSTGGRDDTGHPVLGTFATAAAALPRIAAMGFDVVYLPPIHPIGHKHR